MNRARSKGITLIEIILVIGLLTVLLSFAAPSFSAAAAKAEMSAALENVRYSLTAARRTARMSESPVVVNIPSATDVIPQMITFSAPGKRGVDSVLQIQKLVLPEDITLVSDHSSFEFDERGLVKNPGQILLVSKVDESITSVIEIQ